MNEIHHGDIKINSIGRVSCSNAVQIGQSLFDEAGSKIVASLVEKAKAKGVELILPVDYVTADKFDKNATVGERCERCTFTRLDWLCD